jgi:hypothetical protein
MRRRREARDYALRDVGAAWRGSVAEPVVSELTTTPPVYKRGSQKAAPLRIDAPHSTLFRFMPCTHGSIQHQIGSNAAMDLQSF